MQVHWNNGVRVMRVFGHSEGFGTPTDSPLKNPIQPRIGTFNEAALRRFDYALYAAGKVRNENRIMRRSVLYYKHMIDIENGHGTARKQLQQ